MAKQVDDPADSPKPSGKAPVKKVTARTIQERYDKGLKATMFERREYWINYAFLRGRQWVYWNRTTRRIDDVARTRGRYQATIDRLAPASRTLMAKLTERPLQFDVPPSGADDDSILGARTSEAILRSLVIDHDWESLREDLAWAVWTGGTAAICIDWDTEAGDELPRSEDDDAAGGPMHLGDICETILTIPEFVVEPGARRAEKARWWVKSIILPPETVQAMFDMPETPPANAQSSNSPYNQRVIMADDQTMNLVDGTLVLTYYERPNTLNPKGSQCVVVDGQIVEDKEWPFPFTDRLNLAVIRETPVNGRWTGETMLSKATKVQTAYNAAWTNYLEHLKKAGNARLMVPMSQAESVDALTDDPGKPLKFMDGPGASMPAYLNPPNLPPWVREIIMELRSEIDDIVGMSDVARGTAPANAPDSGYGFQILNENTNTPVGRLSKEMSRGWSHFGTMALKIYEENVENTHTAVVRSPKQPPVTVPWTGKDLAGQTTAVVPLDSILPRSRAAMQQMAEKLATMRPDLIRSFSDFARMAELPGADDLIWAVDEQTALAQTYCHYMAEGQMIEPKPWHDSTVMIREINRFRCTPRYERLKPELQELFEIAAQAYDTMGKEQAGQRQAEATMSPVLGQTPDQNGAPSLTVPGGPMLAGTQPPVEQQGSTAAPDQQQQLPPVGG